jgi:hypothetical protein
MLGRRHGAMMSELWDCRPMSPKLAHVSTQVVNDAGYCGWGSYTKMVCIGKSVVDVQEYNFQVPKPSWS